MLEGASISAQLARGNVTEQVPHTASVCVMAREILSPLQPQDAGGGLTATPAAAHSHAVVLCKWFLVSLRILPTPSEVYSFTSLYVVEEKEPGWVQGSAFVGNWTAHAVIHPFAGLEALGWMSWEHTQADVFPGSVLVTAQVTYPKSSRVSRGDGLLAPLSYPSHSLITKK